MQFRVLQDWLNVHRCKARVLRPFVNEWRLAFSGSSRDSADLWVQVDLSPTEVRSQCIEVIAAQLNLRSDEIVGLLSEAVLDIGLSASPKTHQAYTLHRPSQPIECFVPFDGSCKSVLWLVHELAHAVQLQLSPTALPPVLREFFAIWVECAFATHLEDTNHPAAPAVRRALDAEFAEICVPDLATLYVDLRNPSSPYDYRWNHALACSLVLSCLHYGAAIDLGRLVERPASLDQSPFNEFLRSAKPVNQLPVLDTALFAESPGLAALQHLGAMAMLECEYVIGPADQSIETNKKRLMGGVNTGQAFIQLDERQRPVAYATWAIAESGDTGASIVLERQCAPFADFRALHGGLNQHLRNTHGVYDVVSIHKGAAEARQRPW